jgi:hypothetical protein
MGLSGWGGLKIWVKQLFVSGEGFVTVDAKEVVQPLDKILV